MPVVRHAVLGRVLAHRRDDDAVGEQQVAQRNGVNIGGGARLGRGSRATPGCVAPTAPGEPVVDARDERRVAQLQVLVRDAQAARQQRERELERLEVACSARCPRTTGGSPAPRAAGSRPPGAAPPRRPRAPSGTSRRARRSAAASAIASSIASLVPEPTEKCAVCAASPTSTTLPWCQRALRMVGNARQIERFETSRWPASSSANSRSQNAIVSASSARSSPAARQVSSRGLDDERRAVRARTGRRAPATARARRA